MAGTVTGTATNRYAVVTGANKGIGFEICRQLASNGITVILTARDEKRGTEALEKLKGSGLSDLVVFHQLDVANPSSIASLADFVKTQFGRLDILVNNAGIVGGVADWDALKALYAGAGAGSRDKINWNELMTQTYESAKECLETNYYGAKRMIEAFVPLLQLSNSPRIVNVSSSMGQLKHIPSELVKRVLNDAETLTEDKIDELLNEFLEDFKEKSLETKGWPTFLCAYTVSKAAMNAYTRILAKKYPTFRINCVCPGYVKTEINGNTGIFSVEEGAEHPVRLALLPDDGPTGLFFVRKEVSSFVGSARDEKRGTEALEKLKGSGLSDLVVFHQLDVANPSSIASLADFVKTQFGRLDILVNNAGISGGVMNWDAFKALQAAAGAGTYEMAKECLETNYYGAKRMIEAFIPLLQLSNSSRIVNVSSSMGQLKNIPSERIKGVLNDAETLTKDKLLNEFLEDFEEKSLEIKGWPTFLSAYTVSKAAMNAHTRILAKKYPTFCIHCVCPGYVIMDFNDNNGISSVEEGAEHPVRLTLLLDDGPTGVFFFQKEVASFVGSGSMKPMDLGTSSGNDRSKMRYQFWDWLILVLGRIDLANIVELFQQCYYLPLVNNAAITGVVMASDAVRGSAINGQINWNEVVTQTYNLADECLEINYYGAKRITEALIPLLQLSDSARIINMSSSTGKL
ncbi:hypothetical protein Vadar_017034 [Vaccinium darrowii]|uniref:Uncharacterized protein n=1 Tax=Vaccinium darrowii TaxID=229202 RepID=A0ACB7ZCS6_9ERIC|nr:hypothetical protein Vadar_017034 [Vaccinium darrowii]